MEPPQEVMPKAKEEAILALGIDDSIAATHQALAFVMHYYEWDWKGAGDEFRRAVDLSPSDPLIRTAYAEHLAHLSRFDDAIAEAEKAVQLDPISLETNRMLALVLYYARRYDDSIEQCNRTIDLDSDYMMIYWFLGMNHIQKGNTIALAAVDLDSDYMMIYWFLGMNHIQKGNYDAALAAVERGYDLEEGNPISQTMVANIYVLVGRKEEARDILAELNEHKKQEYFSAYLIAGLTSFLGDTDQTFEWLNKAYQERDGLLPALDVHPLLDPVRDDSRFKDLVRRMNFPER